MHSIRTHRLDLVEIGYSIMPESRAQGFATELVQALVSRAFSRPTVDRVIADTTPANIISRPGLRLVGAVATIDAGDGRQPVHVAGSDTVERWMVFGSTAALPTGVPVTATWRMLVRACGPVARQGGDNGDVFLAFCGIPGFTFSMTVPVSALTDTIHGAAAAATRLTSPIGMVSVPATTRPGVIGAASCNHPRTISNCSPCPLFSVSDPTASFSSLAIARSRLMSMSSAMPIGPRFGSIRSAFTPAVAFRAANSPVSFSWSASVKSPFSAAGMTTSPIEHWPAIAQAVRVSADTLSVDLADGRTIAVPLEWFPRLANASPTERDHWRFIGQGEGIHWPDIDEDISVDNLLDGARSGESQQSFKRWLDNRAHAT